MSAPEQIARIRISLDHIEPEIWRLIDVPVAMHLSGLHDVIQAAMGWQNYHLFEFRIGDKRYGLPEGKDREVQQAKSVRLAAVLAQGIKRLDYVYDFGDDWEHTIAIESVTEADAAVKYPRFVAGARRSPPEDVGGPPGFFDFLEAMANPKHSEHRHLVEWYGGPYDPDSFDEPQIKLRLGGIAKRRPAGKLDYAKSQLVKR
jgi:pRiA4b ORF-3-like protein